MKTESLLMPVFVKQVCKERVPDQVKEVKIESGHKYFASHQKNIGTEKHKDRKTSDYSKDCMGVYETTQAFNAMYGIQPSHGQMEANKEQLQLLGAPRSELALDIKQPEPIQYVKALKPIMISSNSKKDQVMT